MEAFLGTILPVGFNFAPRGWAFCNAQLLPISQNTALFSLLGTFYGGDGVNTFGLPDLRGRAIVGSQGNGPGLTPIVLGEIGGANSAPVTSTGAAVITIGSTNLPAHTHDGSVTGSSFTATSTLNATSLGPASPPATAPSTNAVLCNSGTGGSAGAVYFPTPNPATNLVALNTASVATTVGGSAAFTTTSTGNGQPLNAPVTVHGNAPVMPPFLGISYIIALTGIFPSRN